MSEVIDQRVVEMRFDNADFEKNVGVTMSTIDKLKSKLNFTGSVKGLGDLGKAAENVNMGALAASVESVQRSFSALEVVGIGVLTNIATQALHTGTQIIKSLTLDPIFTGFDEYETKINAIQTIMSNTASKGTKMEDVTRVLDELNTYADKTIYNFAEMTRNIGTFTAAGIGLEDSASAIQGIANLAAASGSNSQQASTAMYQLSQALAAGTVKLMDWNSVVNAGMGGEKFQEALKATAREYGIAVDSMIADSGSFRESLSKGWITADVLQKTLQKFTVEGAKEYSQSMVEMGKYTQEQADALIAEAQAMEDAATKVKTFTQLMDTMKESVQSGWAQTWELIFGNFEEAKEFFTGVSDMFGGFISSVSDARNALVSAVMGSPWDRFSKEIEAAGVDIEDFKKKSWDLAKEYGLVTDELIDNAGSWEASLQNGWLSNDIVVEVLKDYQNSAEGLTKSTEDMTEKLEYFQDVVNKVWMGDFKNGEERVKALTAAGYDYAEVQELINKTVDGHKLTLEDLNIEQAKALGFTEEQIAMLEELSIQAKTTGSSLNQLIEDISKPSGRELLLGSFKNVLEAVLKLITSVRTAWGEVFKVNPQAIYNVLEALNNFTSGLVMSDETSNKLVRTLRGLFSILHIITTLVGSTLTKSIKIVNRILAKFDLNILDVTATIGDAIYQFDQFVSSVDVVGIALDKIVEGSIFVIMYLKQMVEQFLEIPGVRNAIERFSERMNKLFGSLGEIFGDVGVEFEKFIERTRQLDGLTLSNIIRAFTDFKDTVLASLGDAFKNVFDESADAFEDFGDRIDQAVENSKTTFSNFIKMVSEFTGKVTEFVGENVTLADVFAVVLGFGTVKGIQKLSSAISTLGGPIKSFDSLLGSIAGSFKAFTAQIKGNALLKTALAIGVLAASIAALSMLDQEKVRSAAISLSILTAAMAAVAFGISRFGGVLSNLVGGGILIGFATSMAIMVAALTLFNNVDMTDIWDKVMVLGAVLTGLVVATKIITINEGTIQTSAFTMVGMATSIWILTDAISKIAEIPTAKLNGAVAALGIVMLAFSSLAKSLRSFRAIGLRNYLGAAAVLISVGLALKVLVSAINDISNMDTSGITDKLGNFVVVFGALGALLAVTRLAGANAASAGVSLVGISLSLILMAKAIETVGKIDKKMLSQATGVIVSLIGVMALYVALTNFAGKYAIRGAASLLLMTGSLAILSGLIVVLSKLGETNQEGLEAATNAISQLMLIMGLIIALTHFSADATGNILQISIALSVLATSIAVLSLVAKDEKRLWNAVGAMSVMMTLFGVLIGLSQYAKGASIAMLSITLVIGMMGVLFYAISNIEDPQLVLSSALAISTVLLAITGSIVAISYMKNFAANALSNLAQMVLIVGAVGLVLAGLSQITNADAAIKIATSISELIVVMSGAMFALSLIKPESEVAAISGIKTIGAIVLAIGGLAIVIGGVLELLPFIEKFMDHGLDVLSKLGAGIGSIIGSFFGGIGEGFLSQMPKMGEHLSKFAESVKGFIDTISGIDENSMATMDNFMGIIERLTRAGMNSAMSGEIDFDGFIDSIEPFGEAIVEFSKAISGNIDLDAVSVASEAGLKLAQMFAMIPNSGGLAGFFAGENDPTKFASDLFNFGLGLKIFGAVVAGITPEHLTAIDNATKAGIALGEMADAIPNTGGVLAGIVGDNDMTTFASDLFNFGFGIKMFAATVSGLDKGVVENAAACGEALAGMAAAIPNNTDGSVLGWIAGSNDMASFGLKLVAFGSAMSGFQFWVKDINPDIVDKAVACGEALAGMAKEIPSDGGLLGWLMGEQDLSDFATNLEDFGAAMAKYYNFVSIINAETINSSIDSASKFASLAETIAAGEAKWSGDGTLKQFGEALKKFSGLLVDYYNNVSSIDTAVMSGVTDEISKLVDVLSTATDLDSEKLSAFANTLTGMGNALVNGFSTAISINAEEIYKGVDVLMNAFVLAVTLKTSEIQLAFVSLISGIILYMTIQYVQFYMIGTMYMSKLLEGINKEKPVVTKDVKEFIGSLELAIRSYYQNFLTAGQYLAQGFGNGIESYLWFVAEKAREMAREAYEAAMDELDAHSPSRVFEEGGTFVPLGFVKGIESKIGLVKTASRAMSDASIESMRNTVSRIASAITDDIDPNPTITPILDLTDIETKAAKLGAIFNTEQAASIETSIRKSKQVKTGANKPNDENQNGETVWSFTQNNYSPKALSRLEIYRQTKNQFAMAKGLVSKK